MRSTFVRRHYKLDHQAHMSTSLLQPPPSLLRPPVLEFPNLDVMLCFRGAPISLLRTVG